LQLTFGNYIAVDEAVRYTPHPNDSNKTLLTQEAVVTVRGVPLTNYMEDLLASKISFNANKVTLLGHYRFHERFIRKLDALMRLYSRYICRFNIHHVLFIF